VRDYFGPPVWSSGVEVDAGLSVKEWVSRQAPKCLIAMSKSSYDTCTAGHHSELATV
jgi:hypothetical protein